MDTQRSVSSNPQDEDSWDELGLHVDHLSGFQDLPKATTFEEAWAELAATGSKEPMTHNYQNRNSVEGFPDDSRHSFEELALTEQPMSRVQNKDRAAYSSEPIPQDEPRPQWVINHLNSNAPFSPESASQSCDVVFPFQTEVPEVSRESQLIPAKKPRNEHWNTVTGRGYNNMKEGNTYGAVCSSNPASSTGMSSSCTDFLRSEQTESQFRLPCSRRQPETVLGFDSQTDDTFDTVPAVIAPPSMQGYHSGDMLADRTLDVQTPWKCQGQIEAIGASLEALRKSLQEAERINHLCNMTDEDGATLCDTTAEISSKRSSSDAVRSKIEEVIETVLKCLSKDEAPALVCSNRASWSNVRFKEDTGLVMASNSSMTTTRFDVFQSAQKFALTVKILSKIYKLIQTNTYCTKRELYYQDVQLYSSQAVVDDIVNNISCMLQLPRWQLHVLATSKGLVAGDLQFSTADGEYVDCSHTNTGVLIPNHVQGISNIQSGARMVLVIEKDATFQYLLDNSILNDIGPAILVTGKGFPDVNTRLLLRMLWTNLQLPTLALVDADPHGIEIMSIFKYGSKAQSYEAGSLTLPSIKWLGILPSDLERLGIAKKCQLPVTERDIAKAKELLKRPYISCQTIWRKEIEVILETKLKGEIQCLASLGEDFLAKVYLPNKLRISSWL